jgi:alpha-ketoglutarate-dependent taurine dioxygenase
MRIMNSLNTALNEILNISVTVREIEPFGLQILARHPFQKLTPPRRVFQELIQTSPLVLFRGFEPFSKEDLLSICADDPEKDLLHWDFGPVMELKKHVDPKNYLFSNEAVPFHWDGAFHTVPSYLVFNCLEAPSPNSGGETLFCSAESILSHASDEELKLWDQIYLTYETEKKAHYGGKFRVKMLGKHPKSGKPILRYAEPVDTSLNPVFLEIEGASNPDRFIAQMKQKIYASSNCYTHQWQAGDFLIADNHSLIHGRNAYLEASARHIRRVQIL